MRLLVNFLQHEMLISAFLGLLSIPLNSLDRSFYRLAFVYNFHIPGTNNTAIFFLKINDPVGIFQQSRNIRSYKVFPVAYSQDKRAVFTGKYKPVVSFGHNDDGI